MRILFTGASSFTGQWFVGQLAAQGHDVVMPFRRPYKTYEGLRRQRVDAAMQHGEAIFECAFGDDRFLDLISQSTSWDVLCHHAADVTDYKSPDFDVAAAVQNNTHRLKAVLEGLAGRGCRRFVLTGSVFEPGEGGGFGRTSRFFTLRFVQSVNCSDCGLLCECKWNAFWQIRHPQPIWAVRRATFYAVSDAHLVRRRCRVRPYADVCARQYPCVSDGTALMLKFCQCHVRNAWRSTNSIPAVTSSRKGPLLSVSQAK